MRWLSRSEHPVFEVPHALTIALVLVNAAVYTICFRQSGTAIISSDVLLRDGAMYSRALAQHEYWRLITYGFLHADGVHLASNMICLMFWGAHLEKRIGHLYFLLTYLGALVVGALVSDYTHTRDYLTVGASGATSGVLGALLFLGLFGKIPLSAGFFVANIGLNVALGVLSPRINWATHLGGFAAGLIGCALIDLVERVLGYALRCKFPEFVKLNGFLIAAAAMLLLNMASPVPFSQGFGSAMLAALAAVALIGIKVLDLLLSVRKGLAIIVTLFAGANSGIALLWAANSHVALANFCELPVGQFQRLLDFGCANRAGLAAVVAVAILIATFVANRSELIRGLADVGFVGNSLRAERARRSGL